MKIGVIDGQGGGIGRTLVTRLRQSFDTRLQITAIGTNSVATMAMVRAGADMGATGENAVAVNAPHFDVILGTMGIIIANSMLGEMTPRMACAISESAALKILIPMNRCNVLVAGIKNEPIETHISAALELVRELLEREKPD